jgi:hypothetical protein
MSWLLVALPDPMASFAAKRVTKATRVIPASLAL